MSHKPLSNCLGFKILGFDKKWIYRNAVIIVRRFFIFYFYFFITLAAGLQARSQYSEGPATGHLDTGFSWFPCA